MSGGRIALSGFDYQTIVILDQLFDHFDEHPGNAWARPEGTDDLDLVWKEGGRDHFRHIQVKKPRESDQGVLKKQPWRLSEVADELLPNTLRQLSAGDSQQVWILGDAVQPDVRRLVAAGTSAASVEAGLYWSVVHLMARAAVMDELPGDHRKSLLQWRFGNPTSVAADARNQLVATFGQLLTDAKAGSDVVRLYQERVSWIDQRFAGVIARVKILENYGTGAEVGQRFQDRLRREYRLPAEVVADSLFGNLRSFINDVAKQPGQMIDRQSFEIQLRSAWPQMSSATEPPIAPAEAISRRDLVDPLITPTAATVVEVIGISGSGKTTLAAQAASALRDHDPARLPIYVRVRADAAFRDVMSGIAFHLLRRGTPDLFGLAVESKPADETVIDRLAEICSGLSRPVQLLLDLADGSCSTQFGRDLGQFARALTPGACRLVVFGHQSTFGTLSRAVARSSGVQTIDMRGFHREEFVSLVDRFHPGADRSVLFGIFNRVTAGRPAGLYAQLAEALARQTSLAAMLDIAQRPAEDMVSAAEQRRFDQLAPAVRPAAERLVCFALPFRRQDAEAAFPDENVGAAIGALVSLGLLRHEAEGLLEMHETVRAGLESGIAPKVRQSAHSALAAWCEQKGDIASQIFHLERANRSGEADSLAKDTFLRGDAWRSIEGYVKRRALVTAQDVIDVAARPGRIADFYLFRDLVSELASDGVDETLMGLLAQQRSRYFADYEWARPIVETILVLRPSRFQDLLEFTVIHAANAVEREHGLTWLLIATRGGRYVPNDELVPFASSQPADIQRMLLPVLLHDGRRAALRLAFEIFARPVHDELHRRTYPHSVGLTIDKRDDAVEILAALPAVSASAMIARRSLGFGTLGSLIWTARQALRPFCVDILRADGNEPEVRVNAWRVLLFIGYPAPQSLLDPLAPGTGLEDYTLLGPAFAPAAYDADRYSTILLDPSAAMTHRQTALAVLLFLNEDLGSLRSRLSALAHDPLSSLWDWFFVLLFAKQPFPAGVASLKTMLVSPSGDQLPPPFFATCLDTVAETAWAEVTDLLLEGVGHKDRVIRLASAVGLGRRRSARAFDTLRHRMVIELDPVVGLMLAQALAASGPTSAGDLSSGLATGERNLWQCIVATRTRDESFAPELIRLATDPSVHWVVRRAAIWASGRLNYAGALQKIAPLVLAESTPLTIDHDDNLHCHSSLGSMLESGVADLVSWGEAKFVQTVGSILEHEWSDLMPRGILPEPSEAARWLYTSLKKNPSTAGAQDLLNALHIPLLHASVVRAFRICGRAQEIEDVLATTSSIWLAVKCLAERRRVVDNDPDLGQRLRRLLSNSACSDTSLLSRVVDDIEDSLGKSAAGAKPAPPIVPVEPRPRSLDYAETVRALRGASDLGLDDGQPVAIVPLDREEVVRLVALADPANDPPTGVTRFTPAMTFTDEGHVVGQESWTSTGGTSVSERLRSAIAAANRFGLPMPWHEQRLRSSWNGTYIGHFITSLGAQADADRLYQALESDPDILLPVLGKFGGTTAVEPLLDDRLAPIINRCISLGDDAFFECLCNLVQRVSPQAAIPLLSGLLSRWASRFELTSPDCQAENIELWRGFARLKEHPRFHDIAGWRRILENVLSATMRWFHKQDIVRVLETDAASYVTIENRLSREENWVHFYQCEIDRLDEAAERLFRQTRQ